MDSQFLWSYFMVKVVAILLCSRRELSIAAQQQALHLQQLRAASQVRSSQRISGDGNEGLQSLISYSLKPWLYSVADMDTDSWTQYTAVIPVIFCWSLLEIHLPWVCEQYVNFNVNTSTTSQKKQAGTQTSTQILSIVIDKMYVSLTRARSGRLRFCQMQSKALIILHCGHGQRQLETPHPVIHRKNHLISKFFF